MMGIEQPSSDSARTTTERKKQAAYSKGIDRLLQLLNLVLAAFHLTMQYSHLGLHSSILLGLELLQHVLKVLERKVQAIALLLLVFQGALWHVTPSHLYYSELLLVLRHSHTTNCSCSC